MEGWIKGASKLGVGWNIEHGRGAIMEPEFVGKLLPLVNFLKRRQNNIPSLKRVYKYSVCSHQILRVEYLHTHSRQQYLPMQE